MIPISASAIASTIASIAPSTDSLCNRHNMSIANSLSDFLTNPGRVILWAKPHNPFSFCPELPPFVAC